MRKLPLHERLGVPCAPSWRSSRLTAVSGRNMGAVMASCFLYHLACYTLGRIIPFRRNRYQPQQVLSFVAHRMRGSWSDEHQNRVTPIELTMLRRRLVSLIPMK